MYYTPVGIYTWEILVVVQEALEKLSFEDGLTKMYNRNKFNQVVEQHREEKPKRLGVAYFDLNGLKIISDQFGHKAGDNLIKNASRNIYEIFGENSFRIGGDEFVSIIPGIAYEEFKEKIEAVIVLMEKQEISVSVGMSWQETDVDVTKQLHEADEKMYLNKKKYYEEKRLELVR